MAKIRTQSILDAEKALNSAPMQTTVQEKKSLNTSEMSKNAGLLIRNVKRFSREFDETRQNLSVTRQLYEQKQLAYKMNQEIALQKDNESRLNVMSRYKTKVEELDKDFKFSYSKKYQLQRDGIVDMTGAQMFAYNERQGLKDSRDNYDLLERDIINSDDTVEAKKQKVNNLKSVFSDLFTKKEFADKDQRNLSAIVNIDITNSYNRADERLGNVSLFIHSNEDVDAVINEANFLEERTFKMIDSQNLSSTEKEKLKNSIVIKTHSYKQQAKKLQDKNNNVLLNKQLADMKLFKTSLGRVPTKEDINALQSFNTLPAGTYQHAAMNNYISKTSVAMDDYTEKRFKDRIEVAQSQFERGAITLDERNKIFSDTYTRINSGGYRITKDLLKVGGMGLDIRAEENIKLRKLTLKAITSLPKNLMVAKFGILDKDDMESELADIYDKYDHNYKEGTKEYLNNEYQRALELSNLERGQIRAIKREQKILVEYIKYTQNQKASELGNRIVIDDLDDDMLYDIYTSVEFNQFRSDRVNDVVTVLKAKRN